LRFDDRLKTVLDSPVGDPRDRAVRWRQLVDLLSRARGDADAELIDRAIRAARDDRSSVPDAVRAATARSIAGRPLDPRLVSLFASDILEVAAPLLAGAPLNAASPPGIAAMPSRRVSRRSFVRNLAAATVAGPTILTSLAHGPSAANEPLTPGQSGLRPVGPPTHAPGNGAENAWLVALDAERDAPPSVH